MLIKNNKGFYTLSALSKFEYLIHGFSTVEFGNMKPFSRSQLLGTEGNQQKFLKILGLKNPDIVKAEQIHGNNIAIVAKDNSGKKIKGADGLVTKDKNLFLMIFVADCLPILAFDQRKRMVGIAHAGWRGTLAKIAENLIKTFNKLGSKSVDILVGLGPSIEFCHYEVDKDRVTKIIKADLESALLKSISGKTFFDLKLANVNQLLSAGVLKKNIDMSLKSCTYENPDFYSWRREKPNLSGEFAAVIGFKDEK